MINLKVMGKNRGSKLPLTRKQYQKIRDVIKREKKRYWARNLLMICMQLNTSLRSCDVLKLKVGDVMRNGRILPNFMLVQKKTNVPIVVEILETIVEALNNARAQYSELLHAEYFRNGENPLFPSYRRDKAGKFKPLSYSMYSLIFKTLFETIGLNPYLYGTHSLRSSIPVLVFEKEKRGAVIAKSLFMHKNSRTTDIYLKNTEGSHLHIIIKTGEPEEPKRTSSKWRRLVEDIEAMNIPSDVGEHIRKCSKEFREDFAFKHDLTD